jgi:hypothetical protein
MYQSEDPISHELLRKECNLQREQGMILTDSSLGHLAVVIVPEISVKYVQQ